MIQISEYQAVGLADSIHSILEQFIANNPPPTSSPQQQQLPDNTNKLAVPPSPATAVPVAAAATSMPAAKEETNLACQWNGCEEKFDTAEDLYNHLCDIHVGRKSTNNLCLTCSWGTCRTTTVKRDHITSHIRVHVPLKPHKCEFCKKAFKRPQDLKKHVKTHADDSVLLRSPEPDGTGRRTSAVHQARVGAPYISNGYGRGGSILSSQGDNVHSHYTTGAGMQPLAATAAQAYYGSIGAYYPNPNGGNAPVYYYTPDQPPAPQEAIPQTSQNESKKRAYEGVNGFFEDAKRHKIQPVYDGAMAQRLSALQQFVPATTAEGTDYNHHAATVTAPPTGVAPVNQQYTLPSLRTKQDLIDADNFLTQLSANVYESPAAAGVTGAATSGNHYAYPRSNPSASPHGAPANPNQHSPNHVHSPVAHETTPTATSAHMQPANSSSSAGTPALSPPTSNYTHSPSHHTTPSTVSPQTSTASIYPSLPTVASSGEVGSGYPAPVSTAPTSSLGPTFDQEQRRRFSVGVLQKPRSEDNDVDMEGDDEDQAAKKVEISNSLIDPELAGVAPPETAAEVKNWEKDVELITSLRNYVKGLLEAEDKIDAQVEDQIMADQDAGVGETNTDQGQQGNGDESSRTKEEDSDVQALYPVLRAVAAC
ncbi:hypothetical protein RUND412_006077 [Rhizina undulata]